MRLDKPDARDDSSYEFQFIAGNLALDFINTVAFRADTAKVQDHLQRAEDVGRWATKAQLPEWQTSASSPSVSNAALRRIRDVREQMFVVFHAIAHGDLIPVDALARVGKAFQECASQRRLSTDGEEVRWSWRASARASDQLLYPVLTAGIELMAAGSRGAVRQCEDAGCGWLFVDRSNAHKRRWCSMADCGNRNKARNFYRRSSPR